MTYPSNGNFGSDAGTGVRVGRAAAVENTPIGGKATWVKVGKGVNVSVAEGAAAVGVSAASEVIPHAVKRSATKIIRLYRNFIVTENLLR
jgi:hypothetical protein